MKPVQTDRFRFGSIFLEQKPVQTGLARFFSGFFCLGSVRFFQFQAYKTEPNRSVFLNSNRFFFMIQFFRLFFFSDFLGLIGFSVFFLNHRKDIF